MTFIVHQEIQYLSDKIKIKKKEVSYEIKRKQQQQHFQGTKTAYVF